MKPYSGLAKLNRPKAISVRGRASARSKPKPDWIARAVGVGGVLAAVAAFMFQLSERYTPFNVELYVAKIASYREVTGASRELVHDLPGYLFWPDRQGSDAKKNLKRFRDIIEANSLMWDKPVALKLEELAHLSDLVLLNLDGVTEHQPRGGTNVLFVGKAKGGISPERQTLLNDILRASEDSAGAMRKELERERGNAE